MPHQGVLTVVVLDAQRSLCRLECPDGTTPPGSHDRYSELGVARPASARFLGFGFQPQGRATFFDSMKLHHVLEAIIHLWSRSSGAACATCGMQPRASECDCRKRKIVQSLQSDRECMCERGVRGRALKILPVLRGTHQSCIPGLLCTYVG
jgi:hypothetical protein